MTQQNRWFTKPEEYLSAAPADPVSEDSSPAPDDETTPQFTDTVRFVRENSWPTENDLDEALKGDDSVDR
jgi:hypothetical protein